MRPRLAKLAGKVLALDLQGTGLVFHFHIETDGLRVREPGDTVSDARLSGTPLALARLGLNPDARDELFSGAVRIEGDVEVAQQIQNLLKSVDIDWEEQLAGVTGDAIAHQAGRAARNLRAWFTRSASHLEQDIGEYLKEESRNLPARDEVDRFLSAVDTLRSDVDRLEARVKRLFDAKF
jgi:ubiquinone biosynthesis protein UbiJ